MIFFKIVLLFVPCYLLATMAIYGENLGEFAEKLGVPDSKIMPWHYPLLLLAMAAAFVSAPFYGLYYAVLMSKAEYVHAKQLAEL